MNCWICNNFLIDYMMLPYEEDYFAEQMFVNKKNSIIKNFDKFNFLYFTCCDKCISNLIKLKYNNNNILKYIQNREIGKKFN